MPGGMDASNRWVHALEVPELQPDLIQAVSRPRSDLAVDDDGHFDLFESANQGFAAVVAVWKRRRPFMTAPRLLARRSVSGFDPGVPSPDVSGVGGNACRSGQHRHADHRLRCRVACLVVF